MNNYIAILHKGKKKDHGILFPDFPGCVSAGRSFEEALREGTEALAFHVEGMRADGEKIPKPRDLNAIRKEEDWIEWKHAVVATVPLLPPPGRSQRVQVTMDERLLAQIDAVSKNRSAFLADAAQQFLRDPPRRG